MLKDNSSKVLLICILIMLNGCTTSKAIRTPVLDSPSVKQAIDNGYTDKLVRWGGRIVSVENNADYTVIEIVDRPLTRFGTPKSTDKTGGRFLARSSEFIEPDNIKTGYYITISGQLTDHQKGKIDEYDYVYPVVEINEYKVWPVNSNRRNYRYRSPFWYDSYWGSGYHPYWHNHFYFRHRYRHW